MDTVKKTAEREILKYESLYLRNVKPFYLILNMDYVKRVSVDNFHRVFIPRDGKSPREGCFPPE